ncbi:WecB/TagA/CpsF family glycosyltransferase [Pseudomonas putida]|uniref:WecB/TagA/CpsF family glycosyltransferase n=1 Tax=Pseudomonas putida TaxID=303 RepID=UPI002D1F5CF4|nr:WecB/TagA/CpsF family glycosyltransferase [Pseudomonas putida]MEB3901399.1 WecB/TagA/CpsF family glycosyltransferase [Pseudomonas putida]
MSVKVNESLRKICAVIDAPIDVLTWDEAVSRISSMALTRAGHYVCICNVHSVVTARRSKDFSAVVKSADMATADGAPVAWLMRRLGVLGQERINGPDLMWKYCQEAAGRGEPIFLYGGTQSTLDVLKERLHSIMPDLVIAGAYSPPFRALSEEEDAAVVEAINASGARTVWVSLGCPKQELWMAEHRDRINAVMIGVGAAFDYHAGVIKRAPVWMRNYGLEWLHRLCSEPQRLFKRYFVTNSLFMYYAALQLLKSRR